MLEMLGVWSRAFHSPVSSYFTLFAGDRDRVDDPKFSRICREVVGVVVEYFLVLRTAAVSRGLFQISRAVP